MAEACWLHVLDRRDAIHLASVDAGLDGPKARHNLAVFYLEQNRHADAEAQWHAALATDPGFTPAWVGLGEVALKESQWAGLQELIGRLEEVDLMDAALLSSRMKLDPGGFAASKRRHGNPPYWAYFVW